MKNFILCITLLFLSLLFVVNCKSRMRLRIRFGHNGRHKIGECISADENVKKSCSISKTDMEKEKEGEKAFQKVKAEAFLKCKVSIEKSEKAICQQIANYSSNYFDYLSLDDKLGQLTKDCFEKDASVKAKCENSTSPRKFQECRAAKESSTNEECKELVKITARYQDLRKKVFGYNYYYYSHAGVQQKWNWMNDCKMVDKSVQSGCASAKYDPEQSRKNTNYFQLQQAETYLKCKEALLKSTNVICQAVSKYASHYYEIAHWTTLKFIKHLDCMRNVNEMCQTHLVICLKSKEVCDEQKAAREEDCKKAKETSTIDSCKELLKMNKRIKELNSKVN